MKKILLVFTGGTFSSKTNHNVMDISNSANEEFLKIIYKKYDGEVEFKILNSVFMLSENMYPEVWSKITNDINDNLDSSIDGIILIHGSDTVCFTSNFLSVYYSGIKIPLLVTAANAPIDCDNSNGLNNFFACTRLIREEKLIGTYFIYQSCENKGDIVIYDPCEIIEADMYSDEFSSIYQKPYGVIHNNAVILHRRNATCGKVENFLPFEYKNKVLCIKPYTGLDYSVFNLKTDIKAIIHSCYHSNTYNINETMTEYSILSMMKKCADLGIDFYLCDFNPQHLDKAIYLSTDLLIKKGAKVISLPFACAYTKTIYAYNSDISDKSAFLCE